MAEPVASCWVTGACAVRPRGMVWSVQRRTADASSVHALKVFRNLPKPPRPLDAQVPAGGAAAVRGKARRGRPVLARVRGLGRLLASQLPRVPLAKVLRREYHY